MISKRLEDAINAQINAELWSAYLYLSMGMNFEAKGMPGTANWFRIQFKEEQDHATILMNYLNSRGGRVVLKPIEGVETDYNVFDASGRLIYTGQESTLALPRGVYMIVVGNKVEKIVL